MIPYMKNTKRLKILKDKIKLCLLEVKLIRCFYVFFNQLYDNLNFKYNNVESLVEKKFI